MSSVSDRGYLFHPLKYISFLVESVVQENIIFPLFPLDIFAAWSNIGYYSICPSALIPNLPNKA